MKKAIKIKGAPAPIAPYSQAILVNNTLYVSAQVPMDPITGEMTLSSIEASTHKILENITAILTEAGMGLQHIVKCSIFLKDMNDFAQVNAVYGTYFNEMPPARETVQVAKLPLDAPIEISCIAVLD